MTDNWDMLGHEWAVAMLRGHVAHGEARHAYLFCGPPGVGRRTLALRMVQALNCTVPVAPGEPCRECRDCRQIESMQHPDLTILQAEREGGTLKVEQVRELRRTINLKPYQSKYRAALFLRFQEANDNASNALLKTLEEAPAHAVLMLTADHPEALLPTIVSRCEVLRLRPLPVEVLEADLIARGVAAERARLLAHLSGGRPGFARKQAGEPALLETRQERLDDLQRLLPASRLEKFAYAEGLAKDKDAMRTTLQIWISYWRDVYLRTTGSQIPISNIDRSAEIEHLAGRLEAHAGRRVLQSLHNALQRLDENVNARLEAEVLLLDWPRG